jgi:hypothetical protein
VATNLVDEILRNNPLIRRGVVAHGRTWFVLNNGVVNIYGPITVADAGRIAAVDRVTQIQFQFQFEVPPTTLQRLDRYVLAAHPDASLSETLNGAGPFDDLAFVRHLPKLRALLADGNHALDVTPIAAHVKLAWLGLGGLGTSLRPLRGYDSLERLAVRDRVIDLETIATMPKLEELTIHQPVTAKQLDQLVGAPALKVVRVRRVDLAKATARARPFRVEAI